MNRTRSLMVALLAVLAVSAVSVASASAFTEFVGKAGVGSSITAKQHGSQSITFPTFKMNCEAVGGSGQVTSATLVTLSETFTGCSVAGVKVVNHSTCKYAYGIAGKLSVEGTECATFEIPATKCLITVTGGQTGLKAVTYANLEGSFESEAMSGVTGLAYSTKTGQACFGKQQNETGTFSYAGNITLEGVNER
jgi:hypothetical protein